MRLACDQRLKLAFEIDLDRCLNCGSQLKIIAAILESAVFEKILSRLGLQASAPPLAPARAHMQHAA